MTRRSLLWCVALVFALPSDVPGAPPLTITDAGYFITVIEDGVPRYEKISVVTDLRDSDSEPPPPDQEPDNPTLPPSELGKKTAEWAGEIGDGKTAQKYALAAEIVRDGVATGDIDHDDAFDILSKAADLILDQTWSTFRERLSGYLIRQMQGGKLFTKMEVAESMESIRAGVSYSAAGSEELSLEEVARLHSEVMSLFAKEEE